MDPIIGNLSKSIKEALTLRRKRVDKLLTVHCENRIVEFSFRIKTTFAHNTIRSYQRDITQFLQSILNAITGDEEEQSIIKILRDSENIFIDLLTAELKIPSYLKSNFIAKSFDTVDYPRISTLIPKFLFYYTENELKKINSSSQEFTFLDFQHILRSIMVDMGEPYTSFTEQIAKKYICDNAIDDETTLRIIFGNIELYYSLFFGEKIKYKFYGKVNRISTVMPQGKYENFAIPLEITLTRPRLAYKGANSVMPKGKIKILPTGIQFGRNRQDLDEDQDEIRLNTYRNDSMVIIGKHYECDIRLPYDDAMVDYVSFVILNLSDNYYMVDCSKKIPCYFKIFDQEFEDGTFFYTPLAHSRLFNLAKTMTFVVDDISFEETEKASAANGVTTVYSNYDDMNVYSQVKLRFFDKPYENQVFTLKTRVHKSNDLKVIHNIGSGGDNRGKPDIFIPKDKGISGLHAQILYDPESNQWSIRDIDSRNGTYKLAKTENEIKTGRQSKTFKVFGDGFDANSTFVTFSVCNYMFFLIKSG